MDETKGAYQLLELALYEGSSLQFWGANSETPYLGMKSEGDLINTLELLNRELKRGKYSDEAFALIQKHFDTVAETIKSRTTTEPPVPVTQPEQIKNEPFDIGQLKSIITNAYTIQD